MDKRSSGGMSEADYVRRAAERRAAREAEDGGRKYWTDQGYTDEAEITKAINWKNRIKQLTAGDERVAAIAQETAQSEGQKFSDRKLTGPDGKVLTADDFRAYHAISGSTVRREKYWPPYFELAGEFTGDMLMSEIEKRVGALKEKTR